VAGGLIVVVVGVGGVVVVGATVAGVASVGWQATSASATVAVMAAIL
jgi:hypothetical protein